MINVFLDPYVLAVPPSDTPAAMVEHYADALGDWVALWDEPLEEQTVKLCKSEKTDEAVYSDACYPTHDRLNEMLRHWGLHQFYNANDILATIENLLRNAAIAEGLLGIEDFVASEGEQIPNSLLLGHPQQFIPYSETIAMLALLHGVQSGENSANQPILATRGIPVETTLATFKGHVLWVNKGQEVQEQRLSGDILLFSSAAELCLALMPNGKPQDLWTLSEDKEFVKEISRFPDLLEQIGQAKHYLERSPMKPHGDTVKILKGDMKGQWRYRIGDYRLVYAPDPELKCVTLIGFGPRGGVYD